MPVLTSFSAIAVGSNVRLLCTLSHGASYLLQWMSAVFNGGVLTLSLIFWGYGLRTVGPIR